MITAKKGIKRSVQLGDDCVCYFSGITGKDLFSEPKIYKETYTRGYNSLKEIFGDEFKYVYMPPISCPSCSYGHMACLGATVTYPDGGDYSMKPFISSVKEGIDLLKKDVDFTANDLYKYFAAYNDQLDNDFTDKKILFGGFGAEGPITSAVLMRGQDFFIDMYDQPDECIEFLTLLTDSIIKFHQFFRKKNNQPVFSNGVIGLCDDFGSLVTPDNFVKFVTPFWDKYYSSLASGERRLHAEGMFRPHLSKLKYARIDHFQPSVSPGLTCHMCAEELDIDFDWMLPSYEIIYMNETQIDDWITDTISAKPDIVRTQMIRDTFSLNKEKLILHFLENVKAYE